MFCTFTSTIINNTYSVSKKIIPILSPFYHHHHDVTSLIGAGEIRDHFVKSMSHVKKNTPCDVSGTEPEAESLG